MIVLLAGAARRSRVRRIVRLAHTFGYVVLLGVVACVVDASVLRGFLVGVGALMMLLSVSLWRGLRRSPTRSSGFLETLTRLGVVLWDMFGALVGLVAACVVAVFGVGLWAFALLLAWDALGVVLRFFLCGRGGRATT